MTPSSSTDPPTSACRPSTWESTASRATPVGLEDWDPERYGDLAIPAEGYCQDIFTQAGRAVGADRPKDGVDPLGGLAVRRLIAVRASQSAAKLLTYANAAQPLASVYDAIVALIAFGPHGPRRRRVRPGRRHG